MKMTEGKKMPDDFCHHVVERNIFRKINFIKYSYNYLDGTIIYNITSSVENLNVGVVKLCKHFYYCRFVNIKQHNDNK